MKKIYNIVCAIDDNYVPLCGIMLTSLFESNPGCYFSIYVLTKGLKDVNKARRFSDYETIGGLFKEITKESIQLSVAQQIWGILQDLVTAIARVFGLLDEEIYDAVINQSEEMAHIAQFYNLKSTS